MLVKVGSKSNTNFTTSYDSGLNSPTNPDREPHYRLGFLMEAVGSCETASKATSIGWLIRLLERRVTASNKARSLARDNSFRTALKRAGKNARHPLYVESEQCLSRFNRGRDQAAETTLYGVRQLMRVQQLPLVTVRVILNNWLDHVFMWALCVPAAADSNDICPPFLHETCSTDGSAVPV